MACHERRADASRHAPHRRRSCGAVDRWAVPAVGGAGGQAACVRWHGQRHVPAGRGHGGAAAIGGGRGRRGVDGTDVAAAARTSPAYGHPRGGWSRGACRGLSVAVVGVSVDGGGASRGGSAARAGAAGSGSGRVRGGDAEHHPAGCTAGPPRRADRLARRLDPGGDRGTTPDPAGGRRLRCRGRRGGRRRCVLRAGTGRRCGCTPTSCRATCWWTAAG